MNKLIFKHVSTTDLLEYPKDLELSVSFSADASLDQAITAFRIFLKACEYSQAGIEERLGA